MAYGHSLVSWNEGTSEIEFMLQQEGKIVPTEVKSGNTVKAKSLGIFLGRYNPKKAIIISAKSLDLDTERCIQFYPLCCCEWI
jgi:hypothetical protein